MRQQMTLPLQGSLLKLLLKRQQIMLLWWSQTQLPPQNYMLIWPISILLFQPHLIKRKMMPRLHWQNKKTFWRKHRRTIPPFKEKNRKLFRPLTICEIKHNRRKSKPSLESKMRKWSCKRSIQNFYKNIIKQSIFKKRPIHCCRYLVLQILLLLIIRQLLIFKLPRLKKTWIPQITT